MHQEQFIRPAVWTGLVLLVPLTMTILDAGKPAGDGWHWRPGSFIAMGALLFCAGLAYEFLARKIDGRAPKIAIGIAIALSALALWVELAVDGVSQLLQRLFA